MTPLQSELAQMIIDAVNLEDVTLEEIDPNAAIFNDGLGLDSIDALEISLELNKRYGIKIKAGDKNVGDVFASIASLADYVDAHRSQ
ncbi:phosphopantetheine-binding protein [Hydrogenovibrio halophilus]|uniref:phosphopantetheine-binding protein n=1 Tax=Hydrogenovibrio halophilus TaxID=373391 RepID=UPI00048F12B9|nr:phosphopantetheine-binding protein [Hydrogenovibrio halophilus]